MINYLVEKQGVIGLANRIAEYRGLYPHEEITAIPLGERFTVLEGNRRVCACKILAQPHFVRDEAERRRVPPVDLEILREVKFVPAVIATTREIAEQVIANLHLTDAKRSWSEIGKMRYVERKYNNGRTLEDISNELNLSIPDVRKLLYLSNSFNRATGLSIWTSRERDILHDYDIDVEPFIRLVSSQSVQKKFGHSLFHSNGQANPDFPLFDHVLAKIVRHTLLAQKEPADRHFRRDSNIWDYLQSEFPSIGIEKKSSEQKILFKELEPDVPSDVCSEPEPSVPDSTIPDDDPMDADHRPVKPEVFFERLTCVRDDCEHFRQLCRELRRIDQHTFRISAAALIRATFEWSLKYHLKRIGLWTELTSKCRTPTYHDLIKFCLERKKSLFQDKNIDRKLSQISIGDILADCSMSLHSDIGNYTPSKLENIAAEVRPIIKHIACKAEYP